MVELWYIDLSVNNHNSQVYVQMVNDMRKLGNGVFTCTFKLNDGFICDYLTVENESYVDPEPPKANKVSGQPDEKPEVRNRQPNSHR